MNKEVDLALFALFLGANINESYDKINKPLAIACRNKDEAMVRC